MEDWMLNRLEEIKTRFKDLEVMMTKPEIISNQVQMTKISKEYRNQEMQKEVVCGGNINNRNKCGIAKML